MKLKPTGYVWLEGTILNDPRHEEVWDDRSTSSQVFEIRIRVTIYMGKFVRWFDFISSSPLNVFFVEFCFVQKKIK